MDEPADDDVTVAKEKSTQDVMTVEVAVRQGPLSGTRFLIETFPTYIGRGKECEICLPGLALLSRRHLRLSIQGHRLALEDLSRNGTRIGSRFLERGECVRLQGGEEIWLDVSTMITVHIVRGTGAAEDLTAAHEEETVETAVEGDLAAVQGGLIALRVRSLGSFSVSVDGREIPDSLWSSRRGVVLFNRLLDAAHSPPRLPPGVGTSTAGPPTVSRSVGVTHLCETLWAESADPRPALQATVARVRRVFEAFGNVPDPIDFTNFAYRINPIYHVSTDAAEFEALCEEAALRATDGEAVMLLVPAVSLYKGPFLEAYTEDWVCTRRLVLESRFLEALDRLAGIREREGNAAEAMRLYLIALQREPCREVSQIGLLRCLVASGQRDEAIRQYHAFIRLWKKTSGTPPAPALLESYESLLR